MTNSNGSADRQVDSRIKFVLLSILLALFVGALAVSNQSLWIDEAHSAAKAMQPSLAKWWTAMVQDKGSDLQMPFYMLYLWAWAKLFGTSEIALRASNIPWFVGAVLALAWAFSGKRCLQNGVVAVALSNAFLWYYLSEARPYIVLFAFSALTAACLIRAVEISRESIQSFAHFRLLCLGVVGMCATSLIAVPWAMAAIVGFATWIGPKGLKEIVRKYPFTALLFVSALAGLGLFYFWTLRLGARASDVGRTSLANIAFIFYELLGLAGLGPGRLALRNEDLSAHIGYLPFAVLGVVAILFLCVGVFLLRWNTINKKQLLFFVTMTGIPFVLVLSAGVAGHVRLLGRHLVPLLPFLLILLGAGVCRLFSSQSKGARAIALAAIGILFFSALEIRFAPRHQRDDYRSAANLARNAIAANEKVWWLADESTGRYYKLPLDSPNLKLSPSLNESALSSAVMPDLVCFSKPDIYDPRGKIDDYLREHDFKVTRVLPAFRVFERQPAAAH